MRWIQTATWVILILFWIMVLYHYPNLPETIPTHYNAMGEADAEGSKSTILYLPLVASLLVLGMGAIKRIKVDESAQQEPAFIYAMRMLAVLRCTIPLLFAGISYQSIQIAFHKTSSLGVFFMPISLAIIFIPMGYFLWKIYKEG